jgi:hypothetical protein
MQKWRGATIAVLMTAGGTVVLLMQGCTTPQQTGGSGATGSSGAVAASGAGFSIDQVLGDPPVTVGDGSLHVHSVNGWVSANASSSISPNGVGGATGTLKTGCSGMSGSQTALLWTENDKTYDISPTPGQPLTVMIQHTNDDATTGPTVTISVSANSFTISTDKGTFDAERGHDEHNREHTMPSKLSEIDITGAASKFSQWKPMSPHHPHYTLEFCYQ